MKNTTTYGGRDLLKILAADKREESRKDYRTGDMHADPSAWEQLCY